MGERDQLLALAKRVDATIDITCPLCGETGFDVSGYLYSHRNGRYCLVEVAANSVFANRNPEVSAALRALADQETLPESPTPDTLTE